MSIKFDFNEVRYIPNGKWEYYDFLINKYFWIKHGVNKANNIRKENLSDIVRILEENNVIYWLQGKTLLGIFDNGKLLEDDHDDDLSIWIGQKELLNSIFQSSLRSLGFKKVRENEHMITFERDYRYIDICLFRSFNRRQVGYGAKRFPVNCFEKLDTICFEGLELNIPSNTSDLLNEMYPKYFVKKSWIFLKKFSRIYNVFLLPKKIYSKVVSKILRVMLKAPPFINNILSPATRFFGFNYKTLKEEDFLNLRIEPIDSFNWKWRARHLDIVTKGGQFTFIKDIINYLGSEAVIKNIERNIEESKLTRTFKIPSNFDMEFWWSGNNYFWYCIKYKFRKNVIPYADVNKYISNVNRYIPYSSEYYESLIEMSDQEITEFISNHPIETESNAVIGGKHRVFAMIGRIISGQRYIPFKVIDCR